MKNQSQYTTLAAFAALTALLIGLLQPCCSILSPSSGNDDTDGAGTLILAEIYTSSTYWDYAADSSVLDTCLRISVACIGSPMPLVLAILLDGQELAIHSTANAYLGFMLAYGRNIDLYSTKTLTVVTDRGTASGQFTVPPSAPYVVSPPARTELARGQDQLFELGGGCDYYQLQFSFQDPFSMYPGDSIFLDTIISATSFILPGHYTGTTLRNGMFITVKAYNGELPYKEGAVANMTGSAIGFVYAYNPFNASLDTPASYSFPPITTP